MNSQQFKKFNLPDHPGVYFFYKNKELLYIGKATSLRDRVRSYFGKDLINTRGPALLDMVTQSTNIKWQETDNVLEALILEANLIKKHQPKYNTKEKDNKSFNYVCITKTKATRQDELPKILVVRGRSLKEEDYQSIFGPFPNGSELKEALKIIRRIFPYVDDQSSKKNNKEFYNQLKLTPKSIAEYKNNIKNLKLFFQGKKKSLIVGLKKEMAAFSKSKDFENAAKIRDKIFALNHINDIALIKNEILGGSNSKSSRYRIEAYDIAHMSGKNMVGVMTVIENGELAKSEYKKFIIRTQSSSNDTGALEEVLSRRLRHIEWGLPNIIVMDGGVAQINIAKAVLNRYQLNIPIVSVVKDDRHKAKAIMGDESLIRKYKKDILMINSEAHRFAITFHKQRRNKNFLV